MAAANRAASESGRPKRSSSVLAAGETVGETYRVICPLGSGGMGEVYEVEHARLGKRFAIKVLRGALDPKGVERFQREWEAVARLESEYVVGVVDANALEDGTPYFVMERLQGKDMRRLLEEFGELPIPRAVKLVQDACRGTAAAHRVGLIHRDLKPENLFVVPRETGDELCKVLDFGVAKIQESTSTQEGALVGTVKYMAPEQLTDGSLVDQRTDTYALGGILYQCVAGVPPHVGQSMQETMFKIINQVPRPLREYRPSVPAELDAIVLRALSKNPKERLKDATEFVRVLEPFINPAQASGSSALNEVTGDDIERPLISRQPFSERRRRLISIAAAAGSLGLVFGAVVGVRVGQSNSTPRPSLTSTAPERLPQKSEALAPASKPLNHAAPPIQSNAPTMPAELSASASRVESRLPREATRRRSQAPAVPSAGLSPPLALERENPYGR